MRSGDVFVHGVLPRSGTNYLARALRAHRHLSASPRDVWILEKRSGDPVSRWTERAERVLAG